jgi:alpha-L-arabinofuranosidase
MPAAKIVVDPAHTVGPLSRRLLGSFVEHLGRCVYESPLYETSDYGSLPLVDAVATIDNDSGAAALFMVNRSQDTGDDRVHRCRLAWAGPRR